jgi:flagellar biosynthetic protein FlhB
VAEKIEAPTPGRIRRALAEGDVPLSGAAVRWAGLLAGFLLLPALLAVFAMRSVDLLKRAIAEPEQWQALLERALRDVVLVVAPWLAVVALATVVATVLQTRALARWQRLAPKGERFDPWRRVLQVTSAHHWAALALALVGALGLAMLGLFLIAQQLQSFAHALERPLAAIPLLLAVLERVFWAAIGIGLVVATLDLFVAWLAWRERLYMTRAEWLEDQKSAQPNPLLRGEIARQRRALSDSQ